MHNALRYLDKTGTEVKAFASCHMSDVFELLLLMLSGARSPLRSSVEVKFRVQPSLLYQARASWRGGRENFRRNGEKICGATTLLCISESVENAPAETSRQAALTRRPPGRLARRAAALTWVD